MTSQQSSRAGRWTTARYALQGWVAADERRALGLRVALLVVVCTLCAALVIDYGRAPSESYSVGMVASRTVKAHVSFRLEDRALFEARRAEAAAAAPVVYRWRADLPDVVEGRVREAFAQARARLGDELADSVMSREELARYFIADLGVHLPDEDLEALRQYGFSTASEDLITTLSREALGNLIVADRANSPSMGSLFVIIGPRGEERRTSADEIITPAEARQRLSMAALEARNQGEIPLGAVSTVARALVKETVVLDQDETTDRRTQLVAAVPMALETVQRGAILFREGDTLTQRHLDAYTALQAQQGKQNPLLDLTAVALFLILLNATLVHFATTWLQAEHPTLRDELAAGALLVLVALMVRVVVVAGAEVASVVGYEAHATSVWFVVPVAGVVMVVRLLLGPSWTGAFVLSAAVVAGLAMNLQALPVVFFVIAGMTAASTVEHTRERMAVLRAGLFTGVVSAAAALCVHFVQLFVIDGEVTLATTMRPVWSMSFAFLGGLASSFLALGLVPLFETVGFVTDFRLMELANLNHPALRQLMLRAPGSYHHSVIVGSLAEAACEAIGANALQAKVSSYFHDIGKSIEPKYFVENQRGGANRHDDLDPYRSAAIIIGHVTGGGDMAREFALPKPILDNIYMHHGTGLLQYFFRQAQASAEPGVIVDEALFRYPGPKPDTREAGVIMLADKVEAATRTIHEPTEESIRAMINRIINSVMADNQLSECPLTFREIHTVADTFVAVLLGIYHQRIEYQDTSDLSRRARPGPRPVAANREATITLEIIPERQSEAVVQQVGADLPDIGAFDETTDYESVENLPRGDS